MGRVHVLRKQHVEWLANDLRRLVAEDPLRPLVEEGDDLILIDRDDRIGSDVDDGGETKLRGAQRFERRAMREGVSSVREPANGCVQIVSRR